MEENSNKKVPKSFELLQHSSPNFYTYILELNEVAEWLNYTIVKAAQCMIHHWNLGPKYWAEAIIIAT